MLEEIRYRLIYEGDVVADNITIDTAVILFKALCERYSNEGSHSFQLIDMKDENKMLKNDDYIVERRWEKRDDVSNY